MGVPLRISGWGITRVLGRKGGGFMAQLATFAKGFQSFPLLTRGSQLLIELMELTFRSLRPSTSPSLSDSPVVSATILIATR
jgi:hypothetical protein